MAQPTPPQARPRKRGYRRLAAAMAWDPGLQVFPRFREANALNLLCLQAEISALEEKLNDVIDEDDTAQSPERRLYSCNFELLKEHGKDSGQWKLYLELRAKLKDYNEALIQQFVINDQISPSDYDYSFLQGWLGGTLGGARDLRGVGSLNLAPTEDGVHSLHDFVITATQSARSDPFLRWTNKALEKILPWTPFWKLKRRPFLPEEGASTFYLYGTSREIRALGDKITSIVATVLILAPVIVLYFLNNAAERLIVLVIFSLSFTVAMAMLTEGTRSELVGAAAAFIAVQVVYIGSALNSDQKQNGSGA